MKICRTFLVIRRRFSPCRRVFAFDLEKVMMSAEVVDYATSGKTLLMIAPPPYEWKRVMDFGKRLGVSFKGFAY